MTNLLNTITHKQAYEKLGELSKRNNKALNDPNLLIKIYSGLSIYKFRQPLRRFILCLLDNVLNSDPVLAEAERLLASLGNDLFIV